MTNNTLSERIREILLSKNWKMSQLAEMCATSTGTISNLVSGKVHSVNISGRLAAAIEKASGFSASWIATGDGEKFVTSGGVPSSSVNGLEVFRSPEPDSSVVQQRVENLRELIDGRGLTQAEFARSVGLSASTLSQYLHGHRFPGRSFCHSIETALGLAPSCMDYAGMKVPGPRPGKAVDSNLADAMSPLHSAVIDAFHKAVSAGVVSDEACAELITRFVMMQARNPGTDEAPSARQQGIPTGTLRQHGVLSVYVGESSKDELKQELAVEFGEGAAREVLRHLYDLRESPLSAKAVSDIRKSVNSGITLWNKPQSA